MKASRPGYRVKETALPTLMHPGYVRVNDTVASTVNITCIVLSSKKGEDTKV
jgi:hypothetical protein